MIQSKPGKLLNPFAFPSETQLRSLLLIWAISGMCWSVGFFFTKIFAGNMGWHAISELPKLDRDILDIEEDRPSIVPSQDNVGKWLERIEAAYRKLEGPGGLAKVQADLDALSEAAHIRLRAIFPYFVVPLLFVVLTLLCIWLLYALRRRQILRSVLTGSRTEEKPEFHDAVQDLIREAQELQRRNDERPLAQPKFLLSRGAVGDGQVFGSSRRPSILLTRALPVILRKDLREHGKPYSVRAAVFHELAHLANRDITRSYWAEASWGVLVPVLTLLTAALWLLSSSGASAWLQVAIQVLAILLAIEWIRRSILRYREHDADLRVALLWNAGDPLRSSLGESGSPSTGPGGLGKLLARLRRKHPSTAERREILDQPSRALALSLDVPFLAGLLFGNLVVSILALTAVIVLTTDALGVLITNSFIEGLIESQGPVMAFRLYYPLGGVLWGTLMFTSSLGLLCAGSYLLAGTLGAQAQRESVLQLVEADRNPRPYLSLLKPAFFTAVGFETGLVLLPMTPALPGQSWGFLGLVAWVSFATLPFWGWLSVIRFFARRLIGTHFARRRPAPQLRIVTWAATILLWPLILILLGGQFWIWPSIQLIRGMGALAMGSIGLLGFLFLLALMLLGLAIREVRREEKPPSCPSCGSIVSPASAADDCPNCGNRLAPWLFVQQPPASKGGMA